MSTNVRNPSQSIDPRPSYFALGVDARGRHHCYSTKADRVYVIDDVDVVHIRELDGASIDAWMDAVDKQWGWTSRSYGGSLIDILVDGFREAE